MKRTAHYLLCGLFGVITLAFVWLPVPTVFAQRNDIVQENRNVGTTSWRLSSSADDSNLQIKGYASATSVNVGEEITFFVTTSPAQTYSIEIYRMGWYGGDGGRLVRRIPLLSGTTQSIPAADASTGLLELAWDPSFVLTIPDTWVSGVYLAKLINADGYDNYVQFVVREDNRSADILYQQAVTTYQAYNNFPDDGTSGKSLYSYNSFGANTISGNERAVKVSFDRPYDRNGVGDFFSWEQDLIMWMERAGYDVVYSTNIDTHTNGADLLNYKAFVSPGHDEYWSSEMFDAVETARDQGVHLAFMGANAAYGQIRYESSARGAANRVIVSYQSQTLDPEPDISKKTITFANAGRPEQALRGVTFVNFNVNANTDLIIQNSDHWLYNNTGLSDGDRILKIVGYEVDQLDTSVPLPPNTSLDVLSSSPFVARNGDDITVNTVLFQAPSGAWVFSSGTMSWSDALQSYWIVDSRLQQATANLFDKMVKTAAPIVTHVGDQDSVAGEQISLAINASDPAGGSLTYWADELPPGLTIDADTGLISGRIFAGRTDTWESSVTVSNGSQVSTIFFTWIVNRPNAGACHGTAQEAEAGKLYGNFYHGADVNASNGEYIYIWPSIGALSFSPTDRVEYCFTIPTDGYYKLKGWVYAPTDNNDSVYVTVDRDYSTHYKWAMAQSTDAQINYQIDYLNDASDAEPVLLYLTAGERIIALHQHHDSIRIDKIALELDSAANQTQGDVNCDNRLSLTDALFILQYDVRRRLDSGGCPLTANIHINVAGGDVSGDGSTTAVDALFILQCSTGMTNGLCPTIQVASTISSEEPEVFTEVWQMLIDADLIPDQPHQPEETTILIPLISR